ncbi:MAG: hypothetical protein UF067_01495 [Paludibacteraceae bacterium]|nr:hypothetical protein [Paludibacteraceae bacterium]
MMGGRISLDGLFRSFFCMIDSIYASIESVCWSEGEGSLSLHQ